MWKLILRRVVMSILLLFLVSAVTFALQAFIPGDPARAMLGAEATQEQYQALREKLNLDAPVYQRYLTYVVGALQGDFGTSLYTGRDVLPLVIQRMPVSLSLMLGALAITVALGVLFGVWSAARGGVVSTFVDGLSLVGFSLPNFWLALVMAATFAVTIPVFPATGYSPLSEGIGNWAYYLVLPWIALSVHGISVIAKVTRDSMMSALNTDYIRTLRAAGVGRASVIWKHGLRNAGLGISTQIGLMAASAMAGTVFVENVFAMPGLGSMAVDSIHNHDAMVTQGVVLTFAIVVVIINLAVDLLYSVIDPRVRAS